MSSDGVNVNRRRFLTAATSVVGGAGAVGALVPFVASWQPSAKAKAAGAPVRASLANMEPGQMITVEWRGKPVFVVRRTEEALAGLKKIENRVSDPLSEKSVQPEYITGEARALKPEFVVLLGLCTHLGCAPLYQPEVGPASFAGAGDDWQGGFFCPCHGSKYDLSGRVYAGVPAPLNLEIPPYRYLSDTVIEIGVDHEGGAA